MEIIIFLIFSIFLFSTNIKKSENKMEYYHNILMTIFLCIFLFWKITDNRSNEAKIIGIVLIILIIITYIGSKSKRYKQ
ncbi:hypothetical protein TPDSL_21250 [Terrisporobacter petrolearius]|uniref:hypothetical protein n=1 Tax=Terrisporobacter petrolearius TaxID=1460447 RepID=UPI0033689E8E